MAVAATGGGSGAVGASSHAACARFRGTDPLVTGLTRRSLATKLQFPDAGGIPEARWMRAMTFERLVRDERFASQVATTTVGRLGLDRPTSVVIANAKGSLDITARLLADAHARADDDGAATVIHNLAVPFVGYEDVAATDVKPDFVVVMAKTVKDGGGSWLIVGDAKDYERLRSRVEDSRLLKGFLQVAVGAESFATWSKLPPGLEVHRWGVLAVPRNSFLQPEAVVEDLVDYRDEIAMRVEERKVEAARHSYDPAATPIEDFVAHLDATFDPTACATCTMFGYCRNELEQSADPADLLVELGVPAETRPTVIGLVDGSGTVGRAPASLTAMINATTSGKAGNTGQRRIDSVGLAGTINVVIAKSDAAALGVHGIAFQRVTAAGPTEWSYVVFDEPQSHATRLELMKLLGTTISAAMDEARTALADSPWPVHLVVPDRITADVIVSIADNLAGVELSRLRWERDRDEGRPALTFDGEPAKVPQPLPEEARTAVSFLLEEDRARAVTLRAPIVDLRATLARHVVAGGPAVNSGRLDYLVGWADTTDPLDHRTFAKTIEQSPHTAGAKLANDTSDEIHRALTGHRGKEADLDLYTKLVRLELTYKTDTFDRAAAALSTLPVSKLRDAYRAIEADAQVVWRRRLMLHASDLVRFGRVYRTWRNSQVPAIESDGRCAAHLLALTNPQAAHDGAIEAGNRVLAFATVLETQPNLVLKVDSRRIGDGSRLVLLHIDDQSCAEADTTTVNTAQKGAFKLTGLSIGPLESADPSDPTRRFEFVWHPATPPSPSLQVGDRLIVADFAWFSTTQKGNKHLPVDKPKSDDMSAPKVTKDGNGDCTATSYESDPLRHRFCCRPHEHAEAEWSDELAARRARGELNPQTWPPVVNADAFEVTAEGSAVGDPFAAPSEAVPDTVTIDDLE